MAAQKNTKSRGIVDLGSKRMRVKEWCNLPCFDGQRNKDAEK